MKKKIAGLALLAVILTTTTFASPVDGNVNVNTKVLTAFNQQFAYASDTKWHVTENYIQATFKMNEQFMIAYFSEAGELLGISRNMIVHQLPINLQADIKKNYSKSWVTELFELAKEDETTYYITLENSDNKLSLKSTDGNTWTVFKKIKKSAE